MDWVNLIQSIGFPIACVIACAYFIYTYVNRDKDEAKSREDRLIESNTQFSLSLNKVADTITESDKVNKELSETNRLLVEKVEMKLQNIDNNISIIAEKLDDK